MSSINIANAAWKQLQVQILESWTNLNGTFGKPGYDCMIDLKVKISATGPGDNSYQIKNRNSVLVDKQLEWVFKILYLLGKW